MLDSSVTAVSIDNHRTQKAVDREFRASFDLFRGRSYLNNNNNNNSDDSKLYSRE